MNVLHVIRRVTNGGASLGMLRQCIDGPEGVCQKVVSLCEPDLKALSRFVSANVEVIWKREDIPSAVLASDILQVEWWNNPEVNAFLVQTDLPPCRIQMHARGHFSAPWMCPTVSLLSRVDLCSVTTPSAAKNPTFARACKQAALPYPPCIFSAAPLLSLPLETSQSKMKFGITFGYLGTVEPIKMHSAAMKMAAEILKAIPTARFRFAGEGSLDYYREECQALGIANQVEFDGFVDSPASFLSELDIFFYPLNPFTYATSEKALQEAMGMGLPCVVFPYGGIQDLVTPHCAAIASIESDFVAACIALGLDADRRAKIAAAAVQRIHTFAYISDWRTHLYNTWTDLMGHKKSTRNALSVADSDLFTHCTNTSAINRDALEPALQADFDRVAAFVEEGYAEWIETK